ncbi:MAG: amidohydrolase [Streptosporangiaceae bacterium]|jgi:predicted amidohydrolase YtcJ
MTSLALVNGKVWTRDGFRDAVAADGRTITATGTDDEIRELITPRTRVLDLRGKLVIPAFGDAHIHAVSAGLESLSCDLTSCPERRDCLSAIAAYAQSLAPGAWVSGGGWSMPAFPGGTPTAADLDQVTGGRPALLLNRDHHSAWVNTVALRRARIDARTPDPPDGRIERDPRGAPAGTLHDGAVRLVADLMPAVTPEQLTAGLLAAQARLHSLGIASWQDACVGAAPELGIADSFETYRRADADGLLTARVNAALWWDRHRGLDQIDGLLARKTRATGNFRATSVKIMLDGICETFTAAMSEPYLGGHGRGELFIDPAELATVVMGLEDFQLHIHAIGDRAVTTALDALAGLSPAARAAGRHHIAHLQFVRPSDVPRFAELGVIANFQPLWACLDDQMEVLTLPFAGAERSAWQYPIGGVLRGGGRIAFGSDWPVSSPDPLEEIHVAVNRTASPASRAGARDEPFLPEQAITVTEAMSAFTSGVAYVNHAEDVTGVLAAGMRADIAVLDQDVFAIPARDIGTTSVVMTVADGTVVHDQLS